MRATYLGPFCHLYNSIDLSITSGAVTTLTYDTEIDDPFDMHMAASGLGAVVLPVGGVYAGQLNIEFEAVNGTGYRLGAVQLNASTYIAELQVNATSGVTSKLPVPFIRRFAQGDVLRTRVLHTAGVACKVLRTPDYSAEFVVNWLRP